MLLEWYGEWYASIHVEGDFLCLVNRSQFLRLILHLESKSLVLQWCKKRNSVIRSKKTVISMPPPITSCNWYPYGINPLTQWSSWPQSSESATQTAPIKKRRGFVYQKLSTASHSNGEECHRIAASLHLANAHFWAALKAAVDKNYYIGLMWYRFTDLVNEILALTR